MLKPVVLVALVFASTPVLAARVQLAGEVTYRERIALPTEAILKIELIDLALPDPAPLPLAWNATAAQAARALADAAREGAGAVRLKRGPAPPGPLLDLPDVSPERERRREPDGNSSFAISSATYTRVSTSFASAIARSATSVTCCSVSRPLCSRIKS